MTLTFWYTLDFPLARLTIDYFQNLTEKNEIWKALEKFAINMQLLI